MPVAHAHGQYVCDRATLDQLKAQDRIAFRYCHANGDVDDVSNVNGSMEGIAGIYNAKGNVLGLMPHPERASEDVLGSADGLKLLQALCGAS